jgi:hypothetical protein
MREKPLEGFHQALQCVTFGSGAGESLADSGAASAQAASPESRMALGPLGF